MPHTRSAAKRLRQNEQRRLRNKASLTEIKSLRKQVLRHVHDGDKAKAQAAYRELEQRLDRAAVKRTLHPHAAARVKARTQVAMARPPAPVKSASPAKAAAPAKQA